VSKYQHIVRAVLARPWAIDPESLAWAAILDVLAIRASGEAIPDQEIDARISAAQNGPRTGGRRERNVAVIPVYGVLTPRASLMARSSGGTTAESVRDEFRAALGDPDVDGIVFDVDSPGGVVEGINELAEEIRAARGQKPIAAVANHMSASAAYWAMAGADELVATPSASVGSIGIFTAHQDVSAAMEREGIRTTLISAGKYKVEASQYEALGDEARAAIQEQVDSWYDTMVGTIAKARGVSAETVRTGYGEGRTLLARKALQAGMIDRIDSLENTVRRVAKGVVGRQPAGAPGRSGAYLVGIDLARDGAEDGAGRQAEAATASTFSARINAATAELQAIGEAVRKRTAVRAEEGRAPSAADLEALTGLVTALGELPLVPDPETDPEETEGEPADTEASTRYRADLELLEAAARGGYSLPN